jgi:arabinose-5-phosphate isomerase
MHTGEAIPMVAVEASLHDAVLEMTRKGLGMTTVVDAQGRLAGVITDGDLRRLHLRGGPVETLKAGEVATRTPRTIGADDLAAKALEAMEGRITSLVVVDESHRPRGVIHMHDILRAKIV